MGLTFSFFLALFAVLVPWVDVTWLAFGGGLVLADAVIVCGGSTTAILAPSFLSLSFGTRVVTLAKGTVRELLDERVSISEVTDMPGRNDSFSAMRILTLNFVASWFPPPEPEPPIAPEPA